jgi:ppGpp synthetase/RelA/SpoT-type nucleotidyltranferase
MDKPDRKHYIEWWNEHFDEQIGLANRKLYNTFSSLVKYKFDHSNEFMSFIQKLHDYDSEYKLKYGYDLLMRKPEDVELKEKPWENFISKVWRKNVVLNDNWQDGTWEPDDFKPDIGWITPTNWYERIHDIVRTRVVVKYFDGVKILLDKMCEHFSKSGCQIDPDWEAREEGYYAAHLNVMRDYEIPIELTTKKINVSVEIQVTTQIKDVISDLTHKYYERRRELLLKPDTKWQWDYNSDEFSPNYIGHILHYIEGEIMQIRDREKHDVQN